LRAGQLPAAGPWITLLPFVPILKQMVVLVEMFSLDDWAGIIAAAQTAGPHLLPDAVRRELFVQILKRIARLYPA
jgi:hypothetical protein